MSETPLEALPSAPADNFGDRVRYARKLRGLTQKQLARAIGRDASMLSKIELGQVTVILPTTIRKLASKLDVKEVWLETGAPDSAPPRTPQSQPATEAIRLPKQVPLVIVRMLCRNTVGPVSDSELQRLIQFYNQHASLRDNSFVSENTLELELWAIRFSCAEGDEPKIAVAEAFSAAVERMRSKVSTLEQVTDLNEQEP